MIISLCKILMLNQTMPMTTTISYGENNLQTLLSYENSLSAIAPAHLFAFTDGAETEK